MEEWEKPKFTIGQKVQIVISFVAIAVALFSLF